MFVFMTKSRHLFGFKVLAGWFHLELLAYVAKGGFRSRLLLLMVHLLPCLARLTFPGCFKRFYSHAFQVLEEELRPL